RRMLMVAMGVATICGFGRPRRRLLRLRVGECEFCKPGGGNHQTDDGDDDERSGTSQQTPPLK
ncbi:MAG: hypothetical protein DMD77_25685, partial [Candidatus Rokuibacteriota bacterium]